MSVPYYSIPEIEADVQRRIAEAIAAERSAWTEAIWKALGSNDLSKEISIRANAIRAMREEGKAVTDEEHPCDEALGNIHEIALILEMKGYTDIALKLARAHEHIQKYLVDEEWKHGS